MTAPPTESRYNPRLNLRRIEIGQIMEPEREIRPMQPNVHPVTRGPKHHFFGYYDKAPWDRTGRHMLAGRVEFMDRPPTGTEPLTIGLIDTQQPGSFEPIAETLAWHWQVGCHVQWLPTDPDRKIIYNDRCDGRLVSVIRDIRDGAERVLPMPIMALNRQGTMAATVDMHRLHATRPGYGIPGGGEYKLDEKAPADQGVYTIDLASGDCRLIISLADLAALEPTAEMAGAKHWCNHIEFNPSGTRLSFLHRHDRPGATSGPGWLTRFFTAGVDGGDLYLLNPEAMTSHYDWRDDGRILAWATHNGEDAYWLFEDKTREAAKIGGDCFNEDGHCSFSPDGRWMLTDTYPSPADDKRTLILYRWPDGPRIDIGRFYSPRPALTELRCDLHPRWSRDGTKICIDSIHEGSRQMYVVDVAGIVAAETSTP